VAVFTLANDSIMLEPDDKDDFPNLDDEYKNIFPNQTSFPAVNIGHLGVKKELQGRGIGEIVVRYVWETFSRFEIAGCQFITVDALNNQRVNRFYQKLGFEYQSLNDHFRSTRRMYLDLITGR
jgi:ribosomal protein S18 acetylase RimI-like enzyme